MSPARLWLKISGVLALSAVLGAGALLVALKTLFPEPKARAYVIDAARKQLGRDVRLKRINAGLTGLSLQGLEISERPDFAAGTFLSVETFSVRPSWKALLRRKLVVAAAWADGLNVRVVKNADGSLNYATLAASAPAKRGGGPAAQPLAPEPAEFNVRHLRVTRGALDYRDMAAGGAWTVTDLALKLDDFSLSEPFDLDIVLRAKGKAGGRRVDAALAFAGTVHPARGEREAFRLEFKRLSVEQAGLKVTAKGTISNLDAPDAALEATLSVSGKALLEARGAVRVGSSGKIGVRTVDADLAFKTSGLDTTMIAQWAPEIRISPVGIPPADIAIAGRWEGTSAALRTLRVSWPGGKLSGSGSAKGLGGNSPLYEGRAAFGVDLPEIRAGQYSFIRLPPRSFIPAAHLDGEASYGGGELKLTALAAKFKQGTATASGVVRRLNEKKPVPDLVLRFAVDLPSFNVSELPVPLAGLPAGFVVPAMRLDGGARIRGDDLYFDKAVVKGKSGTLRLNGVVAGALAGRPEPALEIQADLDLPALSDKEIPLPGVPVGLELPPSRWDVDLSYAPRAIRLRRFGVKIANSEMSAEGGIVDPAGRAALDLLVKCKRFVLDELTRITPRTRDLKLAGSGFFALSVTGNKEKPVFGGKLQFKDLGAVVSELTLSGFTGTVSFDERRVDVPNLKGKVADGSLTMDLTIKDYTKIPDIQLQASLDRFDLGKYLTAKKKLEQDAHTAQAAKTGRSDWTQLAKPIRTRGKVDIGALVHPNAAVEKVTASWDLYGVTPDMKKLTGEAKIDIGGGTLHAVGDMAASSPIVKVLIFPILIFQKIGRLGGIRLFPDFNEITVRAIVGDYAFKEGLMTLRRSEVDSNAAQVSAIGTIDLPAETLDLTVTAQVGKVAPIDVAVTGTVTHPRTKVALGKFLATPAKQLLEGILLKK